MSGQLNIPVFRAAALAALTFAGGCLSYRETNTTRTPEEQILLSKAVDWALADSIPTQLAGRRVFVDVSNLDCPDKAYVADAVRQELGCKDARIVDKDGAADAVVTVRAGMLATQSGSSLIGIPGFKLPSPIGSGSFEIPELAFFKLTQQEGWSKLCLTAYDNDTREMIEKHSGIARTFFKRGHVLFLFNFMRTNVSELRMPLSPEK